MHMIEKRALAIAGILVAAMSVLAGPSRMDRTRINIGTYCFNKGIRTDAQVRALKDCGIDFVIDPVDRTTLDLFAKHGIGCFLGGVTPWWWGGAGGDRNGNMAKINPIDQYDAAARKFVDHPAVWAIDIGDEPSALDFEHYGKVVANTLKNYPNQFPYLNLFPNYALPGKEGEDFSKSQLGAKTYREHIALYCRHVPLDYISYDHYPWAWKCTRANMFENLRIVADACTATHRSLWIVLQANTHIEGRTHNRQMTTNTLRFQANAALAFGAETISWACWSKGWWEDNAIDTNGCKTVTYEKLRTVNGELHRLSPDYMRYRRLFTDLVGFPAEYAKQVRQPRLKASSGPAFARVRAMDDAALAVGHMAARDGSGSYAVFIAACDDPEDEGGTEHEIVLSVLPERKVAAVGADGPVPVVRRDDGTTTLRLRSNRGVLVTAED